MIGQQTRTRSDSPARWMKAAERAVAEGIQIRQCAGSGSWVANSGTDEAVAYEVEVTGNVAHGCSCLAGLNDDPVCKHRAAFYLVIGALDLTPEPDPPDSGVVICFACRGTDAGCPLCAGAGIAPLVTQAAALVAAAFAGEVCDLCGGRLAEDAVTDAAGQTLCGACVEAGQETAREMLAASIAGEHAQAMGERALVA